MILESWIPTRIAVLNGVTLEVPEMIDYITINKNGTIHGWMNTYPWFFEGYWDSVETCLHLGSVVLQESDIWKQVFDVQNNAWIEDIWGYE